MKMIKKISTIGLTLLLFLFFSAPVLTSCTGKENKTESTEQTNEEGDEHPTGNEEHPSGDEHPSGEEHPAADSTDTQ